MTTTRRHHVRSRILGALVPALVVALAACGSSGTSSSATTAVAVSAATASPTSASATSASATTSSAASSSSAPTTVKSKGGCNDAATAVAAVIGSAPEVTDIKVIGGCMVSVSTNLQPGADGARAALALCDKAAEAGYAAGAKSFSVDSAVKHELAAGLAGSTCIGEP